MKSRKKKMKYENKMKLPKNKFLFEMHLENIFIIMIFIIYKKK